MTNEITTSTTTVPHKKGDKRKERNFWIAILMLAGVGAVAFAYFNYWLPDKSDICQRLLSIAANDNESTDTRATAIFRLGSRDPNEYIKTAMVDLLRGLKGKIAFDNVEGDDNAYLCSSLAIALGKLKVREAKSDLDSLLVNLPKDSMHYDSVLKATKALE